MSFLTVLRHRAHHDDRSDERAPADIAGPWMPSPGTEILCLAADHLQEAVEATLRDCARATGRNVRRTGPDLVPMGFDRRWMWRSTWRVYDNTGDALVVSVECARDTPALLTARVARRAVASWLVAPGQPCPTTVVEAVSDELRSATHELIRAVDHGRFAA